MELLHHKIPTKVIICVSTGTCGGSDRPGDIKNVLDIEKLQLSDKTNKASKAQVFDQSMLQSVTSA